MLCFVASSGSGKMAGPATNVGIAPVIVGLGTPDAACPVMCSPYVSIGVIRCIFSCGFEGVTHPSTNLNIFTFLSAVVGLEDSNSVVGDTEVLIRTVHYVIPRSFRSVSGLRVVLLTIVIVTLRISDVMAGVMGYVNFNRTFDCVVAYITDSAFSRNADSTAVSALLSWAAPLSQPTLWAVS